MSVLSVNLFNMLEDDADGCSPQVREEPEAAVPVVETTPVKPAPKEVRPVSEKRFGSGERGGRGERHSGPRRGAGDRGPRSDRAPRDGERSERGHRDGDRTERGHRDGEHVEGGNRNYERMERSHRDGERSERGHREYRNDGDRPRGGRGRGRNDYGERRQYEDKVAVADKSEAPEPTTKDEAVPVDVADNTTVAAEDSANHTEVAKEETASAVPEPTTPAVAQEAPEAPQLTMDEFKALQEQARSKLAAFTLEVRKVGEGEDVAQWLNNQSLKKDQDDIVQFGVSKEKKTKVHVPKSGKTYLSDLKFTYEDTTGAAPGWTGSRGGRGGRGRGGNRSFDRSETKKPTQLPVQISDNNEFPLLG